MSPPLGSNIPPEKHLDGRRGVLFEAIQGEPGIHQRELQRRTGIPMGTLSHHVGVLESLGYIQSQATGMYRRFAPEGTPTETYNEAATFAQLPMSRDILDVVEENPGIHQKGVLERLPQYKRSTVQHRLNRLSALGVLEKSHRQGTTANYWTHNGHGGEK